MPFEIYGTLAFLYGSLTLFGKIGDMLYMIKLQKGELWNPESLKTGMDGISVRVSSGTGWLTYECSKDVIFREGESMHVDKNAPLIEALSDELNLEIEFKKKARLFFAKR